MVVNVNTTSLSKIPLCGICPIQVRLYKQMLINLNSNPFRGNYINFAC